MSADQKRGRLSSKETAAASESIEGSAGLGVTLCAHWSAFAVSSGSRSDPDSVLCSAGKRIAASIHSVTEAAEAARQRLEDLRRTFHAAVDARIAELLAATAAAASAKTAALENELERLDAVLERLRELERLRRERFAVEAAPEISELMAALPAGPVEPAVLRVDVNENLVLSAIRAAGSVVAPTGVLASHLALTGLRQLCRSGLPLQFDLVLCDDYPCTTPAELEAAADSLIPHLHVNVSVVTGDVSLPLTAAAVPAARGHRVRVSVPVPVPETIGSLSKVVIHGVTVGGRPVTRGQSLPAHARVHAGVSILAPVPDDGDFELTRSMAVSSNGTLYAPCHCIPTVLAFSNACELLRALTVPGHSRDGQVGDYPAVAFDEATMTLLFACNGDRTSSGLVAVDTAHGTISWSTELKSCSGMAVLAADRVVVVSTKRELRVLRLPGGALIATAKANRPAAIAADDPRSTLYVCCGRDDRACEVRAFSWDAMSVALGPLSSVCAAGSDDSELLLAIVPSMSGQQPGFLVVGRSGRTPELRVVSIPDYRLVHTHTLVGMRIQSLAADPSGTALAVGDSNSNAIHVVPWPLPGMRPGPASG
jgi:hypothetical protein